MKKKSKLFILFSSIILMLLLAFTINLNVKAVDGVEYNEYNYLINIYDIGVAQVDGQDVYSYNVVAEIRNNTLYYVDGDNNGYSFLSDYDITRNGLYLVNATTGTTQSGFYYYYLIIQVAIRYDTYLASYDNYSYTIGYSDGRLNGIEEGYDNGYIDGRLNGIEEGYDNGYSEGTQHGYDLGYDVGYQGGINAQMPNVQLNILTLCGTIFMFPFKLIAMGFDVNIFGVNVGDLIIFFLWTGLILGIISLFRKGGLI